MGCGLTAGTDLSAAAEGSRRSTALLGQALGAIISIAAAIMLSFMTHHASLVPLKY
jgi:hypothetical protein